MALIKPKTRVDDVLVDRCYDDPELDAAHTVVAERFRPDHQRATTMLRTVLARRPDVERLLLAQDVLSQAGHDIADEVERQATAALPDGPDDGGTAGGTAEGDRRSAALGLAAATRVAAAWQVRGRGTAETVGSDDARTFHRMLEQADDLALEGLRITPGDPGCALARVVAGRGRGVPFDELLHRFEVARQRDPLCVPAHLQTLQSVCEKWYGSHDSMFDLVRQTLAAAPAGHPVTMVLPVAHLEVLAAGDRDAATRRAGDLHAVRSLSDALLAADDRHPRALEAHSAFGWFFAASDVKAPAREHLRRVGVRPSWLWSYLEDDLRYPYVSVLQEVGLSR